MSVMIHWHISIITAKSYTQTAKLNFTDNNVKYTRATLCQRYLFIFIYAVVSYNGVFSQLMKNILSKKITIMYIKKCK